MMVFVHADPKERMEVLSFSAVSRYMVMRGESSPAVIPDEQIDVYKRQHYGDLQGLNKAETAEKYGEEQVLIWRRSYDIAPNPPVSYTHLDVYKRQAYCCCIKYIFLYLCNDVFDSCVFIFLGSTHIYILF